MKNNLPLKLVIMIILFILAFVFSMLSGAGDISFVQMLKALFSNADENTLIIINKIRLPRFILAVVAGAGLASSGCIFQGILRNPLADPFTLGISGGSAFGASIAFALGLSAIGWIYIPMCAFIGAIIAIFLVYALNIKKGFDSNSMILSGVVASYIFSAMVMLIFAILSSDKLFSAFMWLMGNLSSFDERLLMPVSIVIIIGILILCLFGNLINVITLGEQKASSLGINTARTVKYIFLLSSLITASAVSCCGVIGFVGLMMPHIMRKIVGNDHRVLIPLSAFAGAIFLPVCDTLSKTLLAPVEMPVGVLTSIVGGLFFIILLLKPGRKFAL
ncbi:MAG: iron ABC transporter permease [Endomicrobiaceae bacterium]|jgi:iron complex transport system permease protein|nr:iron ABC transporter permease [Endomicrobiaceae bacterium]MDD3730147.1 iron ABC transporter permease [Endomicrobiaceae bacterium]